MRAAHAFRTLFRAPTAEGLLRNVYVPGVPGGERQYWQRVLAYALEGGLAAALEEYFHVIRESLGGGGGAASLVDELCKAIQLAARPLAISEWKSTAGGVVRRQLSMRQHFARRYVSDRGNAADQQAGLHLDDVRASFNSPFWPFVLGTTSIGQEGLDFHWYCHAVVHWNLPPNPVDLEQREGRVHRYHGHAIRKNIAQKVGARAIEQARDALALGKRLSSWELAYRLADEEYDSDGGLVPHWVFTEGTARIQRPLTGPANVARRGASGRTSTVAGGVSHGVRPAPSGRPHGVHPAGGSRRKNGEPCLSADGGPEPSRVHPKR